MAALPTYALNINPGPNFMKLVTISTPDLSTAFRDAYNDLIYAAVDVSAYGLMGGTLRATGTWERRIVQDRYETFGWLQVESDFTDTDASAVSVTVTVKNDAGVTLSTSVVTSRDPVRVAPFREREIVLSVSSKARVTSVTFASSSAELQQL